LAWPGSQSSHVHTTSALPTSSVHGRSFILLLLPMISVHDVLVHRYFVLRTRTTSSTHGHGVRYCTSNLLFCKIKAIGTYQHPRNKTCPYRRPRSGVLIGTPHPPPRRVPWTISTQSKSRTLMARMSRW